MGLAGHLRARASGLRTSGAQLLVISPPRRKRGGGAGFYEPALEPGQLAALEPGAVVRAEPMDAYLAPGVRLRARAIRLLYRSTGALGEPTAVSGLLLLPAGAGRRGVTPLVGYAPGTHGLGDQAAPSRLLAHGLDWEAGLIAAVLARGYAVALSDYQGLGTPGDHVYMVGRALGMNVLDVMRAARELQPGVIGPGSPAGILGYSEGGVAAAWAAQLQRAYAPELVLAGVAAGAAAADLELAGPGLDGSFFSFFLAYGAIGYAAAYPELDLDGSLSDRAQARVRLLRESNVFQAAWYGPRFARAGALTEPNVLELPQWRARLAENRLGATAPCAPVLLHHARHDQIVAFSQSERLFQEWRAAGAEVTLSATRGGFDHISGALAGAPGALRWLARRLAGSSGPAGAGRPPSPGRGAGLRGAVTCAGDLA